MTLGYWNSYLAVFHFLDLYWNKHKKEIDDLAMLLGVMNPYTFEGGLPIDHVLVEQWLDIYNVNDILREEASIDECFEFMILYVEFQEKNFSFDLKSLTKKLKDTLQDKNKNKELWTEWIDSCTFVLSNNNQ